MATSILEAFVVTFGLDARGYKAGADEVDRTTKRTRDEVKKTFSGIEDQGKNLGQAFRTVRNEAIGLFLAFTGASSLTGFISGMLTSAASADRLGQTLGMTTGRVVAWRQAMKGIGGQPGSADAALGAMERATQNYRLTGSSGMDADLLGLGINRDDLLKKDPGQLLVQMARARDKMGGPEFAARLGRTGMPQDMTYFLQQGGDKVAKLIASYEKNSKQYEEEAKQAEKLQASIAKLQATIANALVPAITTIADVLNRLAAHFGVATSNAAGSISNPTIPTTASGKVDAGGGSKAELAAATYQYMTGHGLSSGLASGIAAGQYAEGGGLGMAANGAFGIGQWRGARLKRLLAKYGPKPTLTQQLDFMWQELHGGDAGGKNVLGAGDNAQAGLYAYITHFMRPQGKFWDRKKDWTADMMRGQAYLLHHATKPTIKQHIVINIKSTDPKGVAKEVMAAQRRMVARADGGVAP